MKNQTKLMLQQLRQYLNVTQPTTTDKDIIEFCITFTLVAHKDWDIKYKETFEQMNGKGG